MTMELSHYYYYYLQATVALIRELESSSVAVISSCSHAMKKFQKIANEKVVPAKHFYILEKDNLLIEEAVLKFLTGEAVSIFTCFTEIYI